MQIRDYELGPGKVYVLEAVDELDRLRPRLRNLIPRRMLRLFGRFPDSLLELASDGSLEAMAAWLRSAANSRAAIEVYDPRKDFPPKAFLRFEFGLHETAYGALPWIVLVDCQVGVPPHCPAALREIYSRLGGIQTQYGVSGTLISPKKVRPLSKMGEQVSHLFEPGLVGSRVDPRAWHAYFECDGDYLCYRPDGRSRWFGMEWGGKNELLATSRCVNDLFRSLLAKQYFNASVSFKD